MKYYEKIITEVGNRPSKVSYRVMAKKLRMKDHTYLHKILTGKAIISKTSFYKLMDRLQRAGF